MKAILLLIALSFIAVVAADDPFQNFEDWFSEWEDGKNWKLVREGIKFSSDRQKALLEMVADGEVEEAFDLMQEGSYFDERLPGPVRHRVEKFFNCEAEISHVEGVAVEGDELVGLDTDEYTVKCKSGRYAGRTCTGHSWGDRMTTKTAKVIGFVLNTRGDRDADLDEDFDLYDGDYDRNGKATCVFAATPCRLMSRRQRKANDVPRDKVGAFCGEEALIFDNMDEYLEHAAEEEAEEEYNTALSKTTGAAKMLVVPTYYSDESGPCASQSAYQGGFNTVEKWFKTNSFGKLTYDITVARPMKLSFPKSQYSSGKISSEVLGKVNHSGYDNVMIAHTKANVGWAGLGQLGGRVTWLNGYCNFALSSFFYMIVEHELGHNFGLHHSGQRTTYDDKYAIMGNRCSRQECHFQGPNKRYMGWTNKEKSLGSSSKLAKTSFTLNAIDDPSGSTHVASFTNGGKFYTLDHGSFFSGDVCVLRSRNSGNTLRGGTKVVHYMVPNTSYTVGGNTFECSSRSGSGVATRVTLKVNGGGSGPTPPPPPPPTPTPPPSPPPGGCSDDPRYASSCPGWATRGYCAGGHIYNPFMMMYCCGSCSGGGGGSGCSDKRDLYTQCPSWAASGYCASYTQVRQACPKSCCGK